jgi:hypothetical protein
VVSPLETAGLVVVELVEVVLDEVLVVGVVVPVVGVVVVVLVDGVAVLVEDVVVVVDDVVGASKFGYVGLLQHAVWSALDPVWGA